MEHTLVLLKPDAVQRALSGRIIQRFEDVGLKIVGMKMVQATKEHAGKHYADVSVRRGQKVFDQNVNFFKKGRLSPLF